jgi:hypothetical protein
MDGVWGTGDPVICWLIDVTNTSHQSTSSSDVETNGGESDQNTSSSAVETSDGASGERMRTSASHPFSVDSVVGIELNSITYGYGITVDGLETHVKIIDVSEDDIIISIQGMRTHPDGYEHRLSIESAKSKLLLKDPTRNVDTDTVCMNEWIACMFKYLVFMLHVSLVTCRFVDHLGV